MFTNKYVKVLKPYPVVSHRAWELVAEKDVLKLDWNELTVSPSPKVKEAILEFLEHGRLNWYPDLENKELLRLIAEYSNVTKENVQYFASSDSLHEYIVRAFTEPSERALILAPTYDNFRAVVESNGVITESYHFPEFDRINYQHFSDYIDLHCPKVVYICNPNNPTGFIHPIYEIEQLLYRHANVMFIIDEAYYEFSKESASKLVSQYENLVISRTFSKAFGLASFRIGYAISSQQNIQTLSKIRNPKNINSFSQVAAIAALSDINYMKSLSSEIIIEKEKLTEKLRVKGYRVYSGGGNFLMLKMDVDTQERFINYLSQKNIFVRSYGHILGMEGCIRITVGVENQMEKLWNYIDEFK